MLLSWIFGIILIYLNGFDVLTNLWMQIKLAFVILLTGYHEYLGKCLFCPLKIEQILKHPNSTVI